LTTNIHLSKVISKLLGVIKLSHKSQLMILNQLSSGRHKTLNTIEKHYVINARYGTTHTHSNKPN